MTTSGPTVSIHIQLGYPTSKITTLRPIATLIGGILASQGYAVNERWDSIRTASVRRFGSGTKPSAKIGGEGSVFTGGRSQKQRYRRIRPYRGAQWQCRQQRVNSMALLLKLVLVLTLLDVLSVQGQQKITDEAVARAWLEEYNTAAQILFAQTTQAVWDYSTNITDYNQEKSVSQTFYHQFIFLKYLYASPLNTLYFIFCIVYILPMGFDKDTPEFAPPLNFAFPDIWLKKSFRRN